MCKIGETHLVGSTVVLPWCQGSSSGSAQVSYILKKWVVGKNSINERSTFDLISGRFGGGAQADFWVKEYMWHGPVEK